MGPVAASLKLKTLNDNPYLIQFTIMAYTIKHVSVEGLWDVKSFDTDFKRDVNILIGQNGSNKTTFLSLIEACLMVEIRTLQQIPFRQMSLVLTSSEGEDKTLIVERCLSQDVLKFKYTLPDDLESVEIRAYDEYEDRTWRSSSGIIMREHTARLKEIIGQYIKMSWLSVDRQVVDYEDRRPRANVVDVKLNDLLRELVTYRQSLTEQINKQTLNLNSRVLSLLLYDEITDNFNSENLNRFIAMDPQEMQTNLFRVFSRMGKVDEFKDRIKHHIQMLTEAINRVKAGETLLNSDVAPLVLINKTIKMLDYSKSYKDVCDSIIEPLETYKKTLGRFIKDKAFSFSEDNGSMTIHYSYKNGNIEHLSFLRPQYLSSGEKQLLILLTQTLLQEKQPFIFIADEPELSLHIEWQRNIIGAINQINPNAQIIVATHSPEIAGQWSKKIITMESITRYED